MPLNANSIKRRLSRLELYIGVLAQQRATASNIFVEDLTRQLAVERAFQAAIEACLDIAAHIVAVYQLGRPEENRDVFRFLVAAGYLDEPLGQAMMDLVGLRNRLVHLYWDVDAARLYDYLQSDLATLARFRDFVVQLLTAEES